jgi:uncharacterized protein (TIGR00369 family)
VSGEHERAVRWSDPRASATVVAERRLSGLGFLRAMMAGEIPPPPVGVLLGFELEQADDGRVVFGIQPSEYHYNPNGVMHGGVAAALLDTTAGCAVISKLPFGVNCATLDLKVNYIRSLGPGSPRLSCIGTVLHFGRRSAVAEARLELPDGRLAAHATATLMIFPPEEIHSGNR